MRETSGRLTGSEDPSDGPGSRQGSNTPHPPYSRAALWYFVLVFGAGFALGAVRVVVLVPRVGERVAELLETPVMIMMTLLVARWVIRYFKVPPGFGPRLGLGLLALFFLVTAELGLVVVLRGMSLQDYIASRDPISGAVYLMALCAFALMPTLVLRRIPLNALQHRMHS